MPYLANSRSGIHRGWHYDQINGRLAAEFNGTEALDFDANDVAVALATTFALAVTITSGGLTITAGGLTVTAGGATVTAGDLTVTAGDAHVVAENLYMGAETAFATTEPTSAVVFKQGTAFAGAITTSGAIQSNGTVLRKIIADGTVSNIET